MRYIFLFLIGLTPIASFSQNPLKKELKGNTQSVHYSNSQFVFTNHSNATVFISELNDSRSLNWNKQINDSVKIEPIGDFWNYPYKVLFKNKINQDLSKANVKVEPTNLSDEMYKIDPTVDVHYPNFVSYPKKGYWVLSKINMKVSKGAQTLFTKSYQEYTFFSKENMDYKESYNSDLKEGANVAMWTSMKRLLDQFYKDLNSAFAGGTIESSNTALNVIQRTNVENDPNLNNKQTAYSGVKDKNKPKSEEQNNYKMEDKTELPPPSDGKLENAMNALGSQPKQETKKQIEKKEPIPAVKVQNPLPPVPTTPKSIVSNDSIKLADKKAKDELRKKAIDSALKAKEAFAKAAKIKEQEEKTKALEAVALEKAKRDSILKSNKNALALKLKEKIAVDSAKRAEINKKIELAKKKREEEKQKMLAKASEPKKEAPLPTTKTEPKVKAEPKTTAVVEKTQPPVERTNPETIARKVAPKTGNEDIGEEVRRIAREVEMEENKSGNRYKAETRTKENDKSPSASNTENLASKKPEKEPKTPKNPTSSASNTENVLSRKSEREAFFAKLKSERELKDSLQRVSKKQKLDSLLAVRKAKQDAIEAAIARAKAAKDSMKRIAEVKPIDPKKYEQDSIKLALDKQKRREAILAAQKAAIEAERDALMKNPNAGEMFALVSTDPPSKLPDTRTRDQVLADRVFSPKTEISRDLLARVKLITPEEEALLLSQMKTGDVANVDSFFIRQQINRPIPTFKPLDTPKKEEIKKEELNKKQIKDTVKSKDAKSKEDKKKAIIEKGLKDSKIAKDSIIKKSKMDAIVATKDSIARLKSKISKDSISALKSKPTNPIPNATKTIKETTPNDKKVVPPPPVQELKTVDNSTTPVNDDQKAKDLEKEIERKTQELKDKIKKAKSW